MNGQKGGDPLKKLFIVMLAVMLLVCGNAGAADYQRRIYRDGKEVSVRTVGSYRCVIRAGGKDVTVLSSELTWESDTDVRFGYLYAPKSGKVNVRLAPKPKASVLVKGLTGKVVFVISRDSEWTGILYDGIVGYVQNNTIVIVENAERPQAVATLSYNGKTNVSTKVTMRTAAKQSSRAVVGLRPGADVTVFRMDDKWSEVEIGGWHGYVLTQHLVNVEDAPEPAADLPAEEPADEGAAEPAAPETPDTPVTPAESVESGEPEGPAADPSGEPAPVDEDGIPVLDTSGTVVEEIVLD